VGAFGVVVVGGEVVVVGGCVVEAGPVDVLALGVV
jgi:hypothetical protein